MSFFQMWLFCIFFVLEFFADSSVGESETGYNQPPVGAYRIYPKTSFQCAGRPAGYYADVESGCQVYHMCDGLGRQFSYSCPNTTLFQQRMLICDHWYMVNCSRAESNYAANLLIGQRDKPFVPEEENEQRTPRPDLLDRPYAADYAGESFRNQYKINSPYQNTVSEVSHKNDGKPSEIDTVNRFRGHYSVPSHWSFSNLAEYKQTTPIPQLNPSQEYKNYQGDKNIKHIANKRNDEVVEKQSDSFDYQQQYGTIDLGVSSSQDSRRSEDESHFENTVKFETSNYKAHLIHQSLSLPKNEYKSNNSKQETITKSTTIGIQIAAASTPSPTILITSTLPQFTEISEPTVAPFSVAVKAVAVTQPIKFSNVQFVKTTNRGNDKYNQSATTSFNKTNKKIEVEPRILTRPTSIKQQVNVEIPLNNNTPLFNTASNTVPINHFSEIQPPPNDLLPPFEALHIYDDATTQGPPIYYEWKMPASALEPPEVDGYSSNFDYQFTENYKPISDIFKPSNELEPPRLQNENRKKFKVPANGLEPPFKSPKQRLLAQFSHNPFLASAFVSSTSTEKQPQIINKSPTPRSVSVEQPKNSLDVSKKTVKVKDNNYLDLKKLHLIPDYIFPLDIDIVRPGYQQRDSVNSFQIKIPLKTSDKPWYGENAECPECHPSFLKPGTCEPCIKIR